MHEPGGLDDLLRLPHQELPELHARIGETSLAIGA
jgi:hypothetical protein